MTSFIDTNILIRHLTGDPPHMAARATRFLTGVNELILADLIAAETIYVLESVYETPREAIAESMRAIVAFPAIRTSDENLLLRSLEVYELHRLDYPEAYLIASAERSGIGRVASFDRSIDRVSTVTRVEPI